MASTLEENKKVFHFREPYELVFIWRDVSEFKRELESTFWKNLVRCDSLAEAVDNFPVHKH